MKTVRFDQGLERRLEEISAIEGRSQSEIIRSAVGRYCDEVIARRATVAWAPSLGAVSLPKSVSARTGKAFTELLHAKRRSQRQSHS